MTNNFHLFADAVAERIRAMSSAYNELFTVDMGDTDIFELYLSLFPEGTNPIYRERTEHDCSCCKSFLRNMGNVVGFGFSGTVTSIFDDLQVPYPYDVVARNLAEVIACRPIKTIFRTGESRFGAQTTRELHHTWNHFYAEVPSRFQTRQPATDIGRFNTNRAVLTRAFDELSMSALETVIELIGENNLYRGQEHLRSVKAFRDALIDVQVLTGRQREMRIALLALNPPLAHFRNSVIGTLIQDLSSGTPLEDAVRMFESKVAPMNYKRPTALITQNMVKSALKTLEDLDLKDSIDRRFARMSDVSVQDVLFADRSARNVMRGKVESLLMEEVSKRPPNPSTSDQITIDEFVNTIVPNAEAINLVLDNRHTGNFVSLTAPVHADAKPLFNWNSGFAWSYDGDITDSIKERVKKAGGKVDCPFRISLSWFNYDDLDLHVYEPDGNRIYFGNKRGRYGALDVDMNAGGRMSREPVENVFFDRVWPGTYRVVVNQFHRRETSDVGCEVEIEFNGQVTTLSYPGTLSGNTTICTISIVHDEITITPAANITSSSRSIEKWGVSTKTPIPVSALMLSPNHWGGRQTGNKHWFFILEGCRNPNPARGIYNEFLTPELSQHRKVFEVLGSKSKCPPSDEQLSGVGFSSTKHDTVTASVTLRNGGQRTFTIHF